jgi:hypothetical protein
MAKTSGYFETLDPAAVLAGVPEPLGPAALPQSLLEVVEGAAGSAEKNDRLGIAFACGFCVKKDPEKAVRLFKEAAGAGYVPAQYHYAMALREGFGCRASAFDSFAWMRMAAKAKMPEAMFALAEALEAGDGCEKDTALAGEFFESAARAGHAEAIRRRLAELGALVEVDAKPLRYWLFRAAEAGEPEGLLAVARSLLTRRPAMNERALDLLEAAAAEGSVQALCELAHFWAEEHRKFPRDAVAVLLYTQLVKLADPLLAEPWLAAAREALTEGEKEEAIEILSLSNRAKIIGALKERRLKISGKA